MQLLKDPSQTRIVKGLPLPIQKPIATQQLFKNGQVNWRLLRSYLKNQGRIQKQDFITLIKTAIHIFRSQPNLIVLEDPVTIVGDIHGQFYDFDKLTDSQVGGDPQHTKYLFLGDYVDRGRFAIQVLIYLLALKISYPKSVICLRGNHQCRQLTTHFNFRAECIFKYDQHIYELVMEMFDTLPLACLVNGRFLCMHGGISPDLSSLHNIETIDRFHQIPLKGLFCDLMWADPTDNTNGALTALVQPNHARGCSYKFGSHLSHQVLSRNKLISIIRAHEVQPQGFKMHHWTGPNFPTVITVFSAPNYCDFYKNKGAVVKFLNNQLTVQPFTQSLHPFYLPEYSDLFSYSIPFIIEKVTQMFFHVIKPHMQYLQNQNAIDWNSKTNYLQNLLMHHKKKMAQNLQLTTFNGQCPDQRLIQTGRFKQVWQQGFDVKKQVDQNNQARPSF